MRSLLMGVVILLFAIPAALYVALSLPSVQRSIADEAENELSRLLTVDVEVGGLSITPFDRIALLDVNINDSSGSKALSVNRIAAGINLWDLITRNRIVVTFAEISGLQGHIYKPTPDSPLNIQPIIEALKPKDKNKPPTKFDLKVNTLVIRNSQLSYDVLSQPTDSSRFNPNHIKVSGLSADVILPAIKNDDFTIELRRFSLQEQSGLKITNLSGLFHVTPTSASVRELIIDLASSHIAPNDIELTYDGYNDLKNLWLKNNVSLEIKKGSYIGTADLVPFVPALASLNTTLYTEFKAYGNKQRMTLEHLNLSSSYGIEAFISGSITSPLDPKEMNIELPDLRVKANMPKAVDFINRFQKLDSKIERILKNMSQTTIAATLSGTLQQGNVDAKVSCNAGDIEVATTYFTGKKIGGKGNAIFNSFSGEKLMAGIDNALTDLGNFTANIGYDIEIASNKPQGKVAANIADVVYRNHHFTDINLRAEANGNDYSGSFVVDNPGVGLDVDVTATLDDDNKYIYLNLAARDVEPALFNIDAANPGRRFTIFCMGEFSGPDIDHITGNLEIDDMKYGDDNKSLYIQGLDFNLKNIDGINLLTLNSDIVDGRVEGEYRLSVLPRICKEIVSDILPKLTANNESLTATNSEIKDDEKATTSNDIFNATDRLHYDFTIKNTAALEPMIQLPVQVIESISLSGGMDAAQRSISLLVNAPYLQSGSKLIQDTNLSLKLQGGTATDSIGSGEMRVSTKLHNNNGNITLRSSALAKNNQIDSKFEWKMERDRDFSGKLSLSAAFDRDDENQLITHLNVNPGQLVFNDTIWTVEPSVIDIQGKKASINNFRVWRDNQFVTIEGTVSDNTTDTLALKLQDINLDYVFETLNIPTAMFGGNATGSFFATELFTKQPKAYTDKLFVRGLKYNNSLMGDATIKSAWEPNEKAITLDATIDQPNGRRSMIAGAIKPLADSLDLSFNADRIKVGFLLPFMSAFATDIDGYASGKARLYGSFKLIDMVGDVYGEDVSLTLGFTNTTYTTTDSVHFRPGRIDIPGLKIHDIYGNTAKVDGWVTHECFKSPRFNFKVYDAENLLVYDINESPENRWFGRVFGNGTASVVGSPGIVQIGVNITTAPKSTFTFVLSDELDAQEYKFITFRDRDQARKDSIAALNAPPPAVVEFWKRMDAKKQDSAPSIYKIDLEVDVKPEAQVNLVMDPAGGDKIKAHGVGSMNLSYNSADENLKILGKYAVTQGKYNFTLQDIIIKEFLIKDGSVISFNGDPYTATTLDINASYSVNANLSDLDESFLTDKDLNRTTVPVEAVLSVSGNMQNPTITLGLQFPTLSQDIDRKVRSIINTPDMMDRQVIYLLALNRFYTPEYMTTTKGNELVSVASSTISSQLSSMLGQLSDKWSLAPNFRSDRGDFSDVEVDVALSSHLLNNRLLLNGNFGYRDNSLNNTSFIGDFDIEYLLNRRGTISLKAYNRYNDQNYYVKTALTTQGVGVTFKRDFDNVFSFLRPFINSKNEKEQSADSIAPLTDSIPTLPADTIQSQR